MSKFVYVDRESVFGGRATKIALAVAFLTCLPVFAQQSVQTSAQPTTFFTPGNLVVSVEGCGVNGGTCTSVIGATGAGGSYGDNQAAPLTLFQFAPNASTPTSAAATYVNSLVFPQTGSGANLPVSSEYGSSSEGSVQAAGSGQYLAIMGYGINAQAFNTNSNAYSAAANAALAQSGSLTGQSYTAIPRVVTLVDVNGNVNSSTGLFNIFNGNNPRSTYTADGTNLYVSGQGTNGDATGGVFYTTLGSSSATTITGDDGGGTTSQDSRTVQIANNTLYVSVDTKEGTGGYNRSYIGTLGSPPAASVYTCTPNCVSGYGTVGPAPLKGFGNNGGTGRVQLNAAQTNGINGTASTCTSSSTCNYINLSPENYFFASPTVLYVADSGTPKNTSAQNQSPFTFCGAGGLQKWVKVGSTWTWEYTLYNGLSLVANPNCSSNIAGATGLLGLTGVVSGGNVYLYATNYNIGDLDPTYLYGITDVLSATTNPGGESFTQLASAPANSNFKGVTIVPTTPANSVEVTTSPSGLAFSSANSGCAPGSYTAPVTLSWTASSTCQLSVASPQSGPTGVQYVLSQWQDGTTTTADSVAFAGSTAGSPGVYTATFTTQYLLTTAAGTGGTVSAGAYVAAGTDATITATPDSGYYFVNFTGATTSTSNPLSLLMSGPEFVTANFAAQTTPTITWSAPAAIIYGSALSSVQLDATASVPGTFVYTPAAGTVPPVGSGQTLSVVFTPTDPTHYTAANGSTRITVNAASAPASPANLIVTKVLTRIGGNVVVTLAIANTGGTDATNVVLSSVKVGSDTATPLPQNIGTIGAGTSATATVGVPASVGASGAASSMTLSGTYTGGTFSSSARITLP